MAVIEPLEPRLCLSAANPRAYDAGDFERLKDKTVTLRRATDEIVVGLKDGVNAQAALKTLDAALPNFRFCGWVNDDTVRFARKTGLGAKKFRAALAAFSDPAATDKYVDWAGPSFLTVDSYRVWVTDEVSVRLKPGVDAETALDGGLGALKPIGPDTFQFRLPAGGALAAIAAANALYGDPDVVWAQPSVYTTGRADTPRKAVAAAAPRPAADPRAYDAGDYRDLPDDRRIAYLRATDKIVVGLDAGVRVRRIAGEFTRPGGPLANFRFEKALDDRTALFARKLGLGAKKFRAAQARAEAVDGVKFTAPSLIPAERPDPDDRGYPTDRVQVRLVPGATADAVNLPGTARLVGSFNIYEFTVEGGGVETLALSNGLAGDPDVVWADPVLIVRYELYEGAAPA